MGCTTSKSQGHAKQKHSVSSKKTSTSSDQTPGLMKLEIACMEFETQIKEEKNQLQKIFESSQKAISTIIEKGQDGTVGKIQGSSVRLINSMNQINIYEMLLDCCSAIEEETQNLSNHIVSNQSQMLICNIIWSANRLRNVQCLQDFKLQLEYLVDLSKQDLHYLIDPALRSLFSKLIED